MNSSSVVLNTTAEETVSDSWFIESDTLVPTIAWPFIISGLRIAEFLTY